jgi:hypothetical protein
MVIPDQAEMGTVFVDETKEQKIETLDFDDLFKKPKLSIQELFETPKLSTKDLFLGDFDSIKQKRMSEILESIHHNEVVDGNGGFDEERRFAWPKQPKDEVNSKAEYPPEIDLESEGFEVDELDQIREEFDSWKVGRDELQPSSEMQLTELYVSKSKAEHEISTLNLNIHSALPFVDNTAVSSIKPTEHVHAGQRLESTKHLKL